MKISKKLTIVLILSCFICLKQEIRAQGTGITFQGKLTDATSSQPTAFTYQGKLTDGGVPANGTYDFQFSLYDAGNVNLGSAMGALPVTNGIFTASIDGAAPLFTSSNPAVFLEIGVKLSGGGSFTTLAPRQPITNAPYAIKSLTAASSESLSVTCVTCVADSQIFSVSAGKITGVLSPSQGGTGIGPTLPPNGTFLRSNGAGWQAAGITASEIPVGSTNYVQNRTTTQAATDFNVSGTGAANIFDATMQYNIGGVRAFGVNGLNTSNVFAGFGTGVPIGSSTDNSFFGKESGLSIANGNHNSFIGSTAGRSNGGGNSNSFFGSSAGFSNLFGSLNTFAGASAGASNTSGGTNSFFGANSGAANTTGSDNSLLGSSANVGANNLTNATAIGAGSVVSASNSVVLGRAADTVRIPGNLRVQSSNGLIVASPNGACWIISVSNAGVMSAVSVACP